MHRFRKRAEARARAAFTLLEVVLAIFIAALIILAAVPSLSGVLEDQRAKKLFNKFDDMVREAQSRAVTERRPYALVWDKTGVFLAPLEPAEDTGTNSATDDAAADMQMKEGQALSDDTSDGEAHIAQPQGAERVDFGEKQVPVLQLPAALNADVPGQWTFWPTGTCEPATVICYDTAAPWTAVYDPLTVMPVYTSP